MSDMQLRADFGAMDQGSADIDAYRGKSETFKEEARAEFNRIIGNLGGGIGTETVEQVRKKFEEYLDEHVESINAQRTGLDRATDTFTSGAARMKSRLGNN
jgi:hypothetical protein